MSNKYELDMVAIKQVPTYKLLSDKVIDNDKKAVEVMKEEIGFADREMFCAINLDTKGKPINAHIVSVGELNQALVHPREVYKSAILSNAAGIILMHNHPSGEVRPSAEDIDVTERLEKSGRRIGIQIIDHVIVGKNESFSFQKNGLIGHSFNDLDVIDKSSIIEAFSSLPYEDKFKAVILSEFPEIDKSPQTLDRMYEEHIKKDLEKSLLNISPNEVQKEIISTEEELEF